MLMCPQMGLTPFTIGLYKAVLVLKRYLHGVIRHKGWCVQTFRTKDDLIRYTTRAVKK